MTKKLLLVLGLILLLASCQQEAEEPVTEVLEGNQLNIYMVNSANDTLVQVAVEVDKSSVESQVKSILQQLYLDKAENDLKGTIPESAMIAAFEVEDRRLILHVTKSYLEMDDVLQLISRSSLIKSLTAIEGVDAIEFYTEGLPLKDDYGTVYGPFYPDDIITASNTANEVVQDRLVVLYYPDASGNGLVKVERHIKVLSGDSLEDRLIQELSELPPGLDVVCPIPEGSVVKSISVNDGICYLDFNEAFKSNHYGGSTGELMTVYSIVNTLTEQADISRVQFLIDGEKSVDFKGHLDFSQLFEYNIALINP